MVGSVSVYGEAGEREVTYWIDRAYWGKGIATAALRALLTEVTERPLYARVAADNAGSLRVLRTCGFVVTGKGRGTRRGAARRRTSWCCPWRADAALPGPRG